MLITVALPGQARVSYDAIMISEAKQWKVLATIRVPAPALAPSGSPS